MAAKLKVDELESVDGSTNLILNNSVTMAATKTLPAASLTGALPAISGASLTALNATNLGSGTVPTARLGSGTASNSVFLRGDGSWQTAGSTSASDLTSGTLPIARIADDAIVEAKIGPAAVVTAAINDDAVTTAKINANAVGLTELAGIARGKLIYGDSGGDPAVLSAGSADQVLTSDGTDIAWAAAPAGKVLQVLHNATGTAMSVTSTEQIICTISLTKISSTSKLLIQGIAYLAPKVDASNHDNIDPRVDIKDGSTIIKRYYYTDVPMWRTDAQYNGRYGIHPFPGHYYYTCAAGSRTIYLSATGGVGGIWINRSQATTGTLGYSSMTIWEVEV